MVDEYNGYGDVDAVNGEGGGNEDDDVDIGTFNCEAVGCNCDSVCD